MVLTQVVFVLLVVVAKFIELGSTMGLIKPNEADVKGICIICFTLLLSIKWWAESRPTTWFIVFIFRTLMYPKNRLELCFQGTIYGLKCEHPTFFFRDIQYLWHERRRLHLSRWAQESHGQIRHRTNGPKTSRDIQSIWHRWRWKTRLPRYLFINCSYSFSCK